PISWVWKLPLAGTPLAFTLALKAVSLTGRDQPRERRGGRSAALTDVVPASRAIAVLAREIALASGRWTARLPSTNDLPNSPLAHARSSSPPTWSMMG